MSKAETIAEFRESTRVTLDALRELRLETTLTKQAQEIARAELLRIHPETITPQNAAEFQQMAEQWCRTVNNTTDAFHTILDMLEVSVTNMRQAVLEFADD